MQLHVGQVEPRIGLQEARALGEGRRDHAGPVAAPGPHVLEQVEGAGCADAEIVGVLRFPGEDEIQVVLKVLPHAGQLVHHGDAVRGDVLGPADAGKLQKLRRAESAAAKDHLAPRPHLFAGPALPVGDAGGALALEQHPLGAHLGQHGQVLARVHHRVQIGGRRRTAFAVARRPVELGDRVVAETLVVAGVEILAAAVLQARRRLDEGLGDRARAFLAADMQRAAGAVMVIGPGLVVLGAPEIGQHAVPVPALAAQIGPVVVILAVAAHVEHGVDRAGPAERPAARLIAPPPVQPRLRHGVEGPVVDLAMARQDRHHGSGRAHQDAVAPAARFQQADARLRILAQPRRKRRSG